MALEHHGRLTPAGAGAPSIRASTDVTARTVTSGSAAYRWLSANAPRFGFRNLPGEPWHWSTTGD